MSSNLCLSYQKKIYSKKAVDSSELSSDSETNEVLDESVDTTNSTKIQSKEKIFSDEFISPQRIIVEKRPRFFSENTENFKFNKEFQSPKLRIITKNLRKFAEDEIEDLNKRKFSFI